MSPVQPMVSTVEIDSYKQLDRTVRSSALSVCGGDGPRLLILGHHYQQDEVIALSDLRGDSYQLGVSAASETSAGRSPSAACIFMAETADILANRPERLAARGGQRVQVVLPDLAAGCSLADMADIDQVEECWEQLAEVIDVDDLLPITYVNSAAELEGVLRPSRRHRLHVGQRPGRARLGLRPQEAACCSSPTSTSAATRPERWAFPWTKCRSGIPRRSSSAATRPRRSTTAACSYGAGIAACIRFSGRSTSTQFREKYPGIKIIVHPECSMEVVDAADDVRLDRQDHQSRREAPPGTIWAIGTEMHLVNRLKHEHPEQQIHFLSPVVLHVLDDVPHRFAAPLLVAGKPRGRHAGKRHPSRCRNQPLGALVALQRMLEVR